MQTKLAIRMVARADADGLPEDHELRVKAKAFDEATKGFYGEPQTCDIKRVMGCWTRARLAWCNYTSEPLI